ncbi:hypothetical protein [Nostoc sp.]|uniref:hypothetical protein n=1 Tax=Nostoc sp. TaxID=1180 RepID=UPI002FF73F04
MANRSRKLTPKASKLNKPRAGAMKRVAKNPQKKLKGGSWLSSMLAVAILFISASLIMAFAWISVLFIFNPDQVSWLNKILPAWAQIPLGRHERPQTLKQIQLGLSKKNQIFGEPLPLNQNTETSFLLPVFQQRANCQADCKELVELRVYELSVELEFKSQSENYYYLATQTQAQKIWVSPSQEVLADLIDGRWGKALQVFEASPHNSQEIATLLKADKKRLWNRIAAALRVNPNRQEVQAWFALILAVQQGEGHANSWLKAQPKITKENLDYIQSLLARLNGEITKSQISSQIVGTVQPITQVTSSEWLQANSTADLKLTDNQVWYQVEVSAFNDGKRWLNSPFENLNPPKTDAAKFFWKTLGITSDPEIQIVVWLPNGEQQISIAAIKAVQLRGKVLRLLAAGPKIPENQNDVLQPKPLALTNAALEWVQPSPITLRELYQQNPQGVKVILSSVWQSLQESGEILAGAIPTFEEMQEKLGDWPVQVIDLTNNAQPEIILTISPEAIASLNQSKAGISAENTEQRHDRTIILSDSNKVIYTDFTGNDLQRLSAIAKLSGVQSLTLLVENAHNYSLKRWSEKNQRFE